MTDNFTHDTPFKAEEDFTNKKHWLVWREKDDEQKACHDGQSAQQNLARPESGDEPTVDDSSKDRSNT